MILGCWNPSVILTYIGTIVSVTGITLALNGSLSGALSCLVIAGLIDLADGPVARAVRRDERAKRFGVVLDSVADVVAFLALPAVILASMQPGLAAVPAGAVFVIAGLARLAHFTTVDADSFAPVPHYNGLPVTYAALIVPLACLLTPNLPVAAGGLLLGTVLVATAVAFVVPLRIPKPRGKAYAFFGVLAVALLTALWVAPL